MTVWIAFGVGVLVGAFLGISALCCLMLFIGPKANSTWKEKCPKCHTLLQRTDDKSLWCFKGCYKSAFDLWVDLNKLQT